jgi:flavin-dependent dehydrogenase
MYDVAIIVGADGAKSKVRTQFAGHIDFPEKYVAIQEWVERKNDRPYFTSIFDVDITDYYCWTIPKGNYLLIGAALPYRQKAAEKFALLKTKLKAHGMQFGKTVFREGSLILRPRLQNQLSTGGNGIALLGEAGGWISPSSAEGLSYAFKSALMLAEALHSTLDGFEKRYFDMAAKLRKNILLKNVKAHFIFKPLLRNIIMRSGLQSITLGRP